jgi:hypothetical protein
MSALYELVNPPSSQSFIDLDKICWVKAKGTDSKNLQIEVVFVAGPPLRLEKDAASDFLAAFTERIKGRP